MNNIRNLLNNSNINYQNELLKMDIFIKNYFSEEQLNYLQIVLMIFINYQRLKTNG